MTPEELHVYDLDGTLYRSPQPPTLEQAATWFFHAHSLGEPGPPGFDNRWVLPTLVAARRSEWDPRALSLLLSERPEHNEMQAAVQHLVTLANVSFSHTRLRPLVFPGSAAQFKALSVRGWIEHIPSVKRVVLHDDDPACHAAVKALTEHLGRTFEGVLPRG